MRHQSEAAQAPSATHPLAFAGLAIVVAAGLALRLEHAWRSMHHLVLRVVPDDSFYYFQIARNLAHGRNVTLDGETVTNGFHPLWFALITPLFAIADRELSVHLALSLGAVLGAATVALVFEIVRRLTSNPWAALVGAGFFALNPPIIVYAVNGLETSVMLFCTALVVLGLILMVQSDVRRDRDYVLFGAACGLLVLARTDAALVVPIVIGYLALGERREVRWRGPILASSMVALLLAPWLIWNLAALHTIVQISGIAGGHLDRTGYYAANGHDLGGRISHGLSVLRHGVVDDLPHQFMVPPFDGSRRFWVIVIVGVAAIVLLPVSRRRATLGAAALVAVPFSGLILMLVIELAVRWFVRPWYYAPYALLAAIGLGLFAHWLEGAVCDLIARAPNLPRAARAAPAIAMYIVLAAILFSRYGPHRDNEIVVGYGWQPNVLEASSWLANNTAPGTRVAAYNAGIPAYFSERTVVNLDGLVNHDAYIALRNCTTRDYIREKRIDLVADARGQFFLGGCGLSFVNDLTSVTRIGEPLPAFNGAEIYIMQPKP